MNVSVNCGISLVIVNQKSDSQHEDLLDLLVQVSCSRLGGGDGGGGGFRHTSTVRLIVPRRFMLLQPAADSVQLSCYPSLTVKPAELCPLLTQFWRSGSMTKSQIFKKGLMFDLPENKQNYCFGFIIF